MRISDGTRCGSCGLPIHDSETEIRHFGFSLSHSEYRCIELLKIRIKELTRQRDEHELNLAAVTRELKEERRASARIREAKNLVIAEREKDRERAAYLRNAAIQAIRRSSKESGIRGFLMGAFGLTDGDLEAHGEETA